MKQTFLTISAATLLFLASCSNAPEADKALTNDQQEVAANGEANFTVDTTTTSLKWIGTKQTGSHDGTLPVTEGALTVKDNALTAGNFTINVTGIVVTDLTEKDGKADLEGHLKSADFFEVEKFPTAKFEITSVAPYDSTTATVLTGATNLISGNLTLKDSTKNVTFPAIITISENSVEAKADFNIDRTQWGLNYKGPNNPQDWMIKKEVNLKLDLKATKQ